MKAPDKIYMATLSANKVNGNNWGCWTDRECPGETYIRKEALMEWKEELEEHARKCAGGIVGQYEHGYWKALDDLIDKLNEM